jgi:4-diphosphocytidyl-2-C-methyl-D-erythritol kinase
VGERGEVVEAAPAKLNLFLRVLGRRDDGYHDIETLILPIDLSDEVSVRLTGDGLDFGVRGPRESEVPPPPMSANLALQAAEALYEHAWNDPRAPGASVTLTKNVPVAAGLGGGSADAAATLRALDRLWGLDLGARGLTQIAARVGSDVPALLWKASVLARGRGESVEPIEVPTTNWVLLTKSFGVSAADAYRWWDEDGGRSGPHPQPAIDALRAGDLEVLHGLLFNDLERPVSRRHPQILEATRRLLEAGALAAIMCGSGPTVAGLARDAEHAEGIAAYTGGLAVETVARSAA